MQSLVDFELAPLFLFSPRRISTARLLIDWTAEIHRKGWNAPEERVDYYVLALTRCPW